MSPSQPPIVLKRSRRTQHWVRLFLLSMVVPPLIMSVGWVLPGAIAVVQTGTCPVFAPDLPAYPCSVWEYLFRKTVGLWALMGHLITWTSWIMFNFVLWGVGLLAVGLYRNLRSSR